MGVDEERVKGYLEHRGFTVERFSKAEMRSGKTPDFRVLRNGRFLFFCGELKRELKGPGSIHNDMEVKSWI